MTNHLTLSDRNMSLIDTKKTAYNVIDLLGYYYEGYDRQIGPYQRSDGSIFKNDCESCLAKGSGKGVGENATVGAICEALESLSMTKDHYHAETVVLPSHSIFEQTQVQNERLTSSIMALENYPMGFRCYKDILGNRSLLYPAFLSTPYYNTYAKILGDDYDYKTLLRYSSSTGVSIGSCYEEVLVHSINECIERDAFGIFLLSALFTNIIPVRIVSHDTLPDGIKSRIKELEIAIGSRIGIFDLTVIDVQIPVFCAVNLDDWSNGNLPTIKGFGCSLDKDYALERSVAELAQFAAICFDEPLTTQIFYNSLLREEPAYLNQCVRLNLETILMAKGSSVDYNSIATWPAGSNVGEQTQLLIQKLYDKGFEVYFSENANYNNQLLVGHVFIPGLEQFYMNAFGGVVLPSKRWQKIKSYCGLSE